MTSSEIEPETFRLVAQCLNQPRASSCIQQTIFPNTLHFHPLMNEYWTNEMCVYARARVCVFCVCKQSFLWWGCLIIKTYLRCN